MTGAILSNDHLFCEECDREFLESHLLNQFSFPVCDECRLVHITVILKLLKFFYLVIFSLKAAS